MTKSRKPTAAARRARSRRRRTIWISSMAIAGLALAGLVGWGVYQSQSSTSGEVQVPAHSTTDGTGVVDGDGPVTVEIWLDLHCPHCRAFEEQASITLDRLVAEGAITRIYHPVAFLDRFSTTAYSTRAAAAVGCAADDDAQARYLTALLAAQPPADGPGLTDDQLVQVGASVGLTDPAFEQCVADERYRGWTEQVTATATQADVTGTPMVRIDGNEVEPTVEAITAAIAAANPG